MPSMGWTMLYLFVFLLAADRRRLPAHLVGRPRNADYDERRRRGVPAAAGATRPSCPHACGAVAPRGPRQRRHVPAAAARTSRCPTARLARADRLRTGDDPRLAREGDRHRARRGCSRPRSIVAGRGLLPRLPQPPRDGDRPAASRRSLTEVVNIDEGEAFAMHPGEFTLGSTLERVGDARRRGRPHRGEPSIGRLGLHRPRDRRLRRPGLQGHADAWSSPTHAGADQALRRAPIAQLSFMALDRPAERPYGSRAWAPHYQGQVAATESRYGR